MEPQNPHEVLGAAPGASAIEIRAAYTSILNRLRKSGSAPEAAQTRLDAVGAAFKELTGIPASSKVLSLPQCPE
jgi:curved DNA-binding protein CbpA